MLIDNCRLLCNYAKLLLYYLHYVVPGAGRLPRVRAPGPGLSLGGYISLSLCIYIYIYINKYTCIQIMLYIHIYLYIKGTVIVVVCWRLRPISLLTLWISEGLTQAQSQLQGVEFSCP